MKVYGMRGLVEIKNLTPHEVAVFMREDNALVLPSEGSVRVEEELLSDKEHGAYLLCGGLEIKELRRGKVTGLPEPRPGVLLVVSRVILDWFYYAELSRGQDPTKPSEDGYRRDLVAPGELARNSEGQVTGAACLLANGPLDLIDGFLERDVVIGPEVEIVQHPTGRLGVSPKPCK